MRTIRTAALAAASILFAAGIAAPATASADALDYRIDTVHTQVHASVSHLGWSNSTARLQVQDGVIRFDPDDLAASTVDVTIGLDSLDLGDATWKEHVSAEKWLDAANFPQARFVSTAVKPTGGKTFEVAGNLTIKGVTRPVTLHATLNQAGPYPFSNTPAIGVSATGTLQRSAFGVSGSIPHVSDAVQLRIELEAKAAE